MRLEEYPSALNLATFSSSPAHGTRVRSMNYIFVYVTFVDDATPDEASVMPTNDVVNDIALDNLNEGTVDPVVQSTALNMAAPAVEIMSAADIGPPVQAQPTPPRRLTIEEKASLAAYVCMHWRVINNWASSDQERWGECWASVSTEFEPRVHVTGADFGHQHDDRTPCEWSSSGREVGARALSNNMRGRILTACIDIEKLVEAMGKRKRKN